MWAVWIFACSFHNLYYRTWTLVQARYRRYCPGWMEAPRITPEQIQALRQRLYGAEEHVDAPTARRLLTEIEVLEGQLTEARATFARKAADALEKRLRDVAAFNHGGCSKCRDAEARAFLAKLRRIASTPA